MRARFRVATLWMAAAFVLAGSVFGFAQVGDNHGADVSVVAKPTATPPTDHGTEVSETAKPETTGSEAGEHRLNHGFYVSAAAHCEPTVDDTDTTEVNEASTPPADCATDGKVHGEYVSTVAHSKAGKPDKARDLIAWREATIADIAKKAAAIPDPESQAAFRQIPYNREMLAASERGEWPNNLPA